MAILMIKNEEKIIRRCMDSLRDVCHSFCISDTGSTDNTVKVVEDTLAEYNKPGKVYNFVWKNFSANRNLSFRAALNFAKTLDLDLASTYGIVIDADMLLRIDSDMNFEQLFTNFKDAPGFKVRQIQNNLDYYNTRIIKLSEKWECVSVTHEYWTCGKPELHIQNGIWFDDPSDGGCKSDKLERDKKLLHDGLIEEPNNSRYMFYLAQTYNDLRECDKAIEWYKKRIEMGGWYEEVWFSMYAVARSYICKDVEKYEKEVKYWVDRSCSVNPHRAEALTLYAKYCMMRGNVEESFKYVLKALQIPYPLKDVLFIEKSCYQYERHTILSDILRRRASFDKKKDSEAGALACIQVINNVKDDIIDCAMAFTNLQYYLNSVGESKALDVNVNQDQTQVIVTMCDNILNICSSNMVVTESNIATCIKEEPTFENYLEGDQKLDKFFNCPIFGLDTKNDETVCYCVEKNKIYCTSYPTRETVYYECEIDAQSRMLLPYENNKYIRKWHPLTIQTTEKIITKPTPGFFSKIKSLCLGSKRTETNYWYIAYCSVLIKDKAYVFHNIISVENDEIKAYTSPFYFDGLGVEHCTDFKVIDNKVQFIWTFKGQNPRITTVDCNTIEKLFTTFGLTDNDISLTGYKVG